MNNPIGQNIRRLRTELGYSQSHLAELAKVSQGWVSRIESSPDENPTLDSMKRIAQALGVDVSKLTLEQTT